jgi:hypothetical protein
MTPDAREAKIEMLTNSPETWSPELRGRALEMIRLLANTPYREWKNKRELWASLAEFRSNT